MSRALQWTHLVQNSLILIEQFILFGEFIFEYIKLELQINHYNSHHTKDIRFAPEQKPHIMNPSQLVQNRSTLLIFRDCLKLANRMVTEKQKSESIKKLVRREFLRNKQVFDQDQIKLLKMSAVKGISNYIIHVVRTQYQLNKRKEVNIMDEEENKKVEGHLEEDEDLQSLHIQKQHTNNKGKIDSVV